MSLIESLICLVHFFYFQIVEEQVKKLDKQMVDYRQQMPFIPEEVMMYIQTSAMHMVRFKSE